MVFSRLAMATIAMTIGSGLIATNAFADDAKTQSKIRSTTQTSASVSNPNNCKVVERKSGDNPSGTLSSSVTAANGKVTSSTTGGHGITVQSGNGQTSSSVATTGSGNGTTTVTTSDGNCIIYVDPGQKKD